MSVSIDDLRPRLSIAFEQRVAQTVKIQPKGTVMFVTKNTELAESYKLTEYTSALNITDVGDATKTQIERCFVGNPKKVIVVQYKTTFDTVVEIIKKQTFNWICSDITDIQADVTTYAKENNKFAAVYRQAADSKYVVNFVNPTVTLADEDSTSMTGVEYLPRLTGALAGLPYSMSMMGLVFTDLEKVELPDAADVDYGQFILENTEYGVKVAAAINSLTTLTTNVTEDMKSIAHMEAEKRIEEDFWAVFKGSYQGRYKNHYKNQRLFHAAGQGYLEKLKKLEILDPGHNNMICTDIDTQRAAWKEIGKEGVDDWTDEEVRLNTFKNNMFVLLDVKILDAIEGMVMRVSLF